MFWSSLTLSSILLSGAAASGAATLEPRATCPLTEVNAYKYGCAQLGWVQTPSYLKILKGVSTLDACAKSCHGNIACKSFRFVEDKKKCYLYNKYLGAMTFTTDNFESGIFYERECYSTDCQIIKACSDISTCRNQMGYDYYYLYYTDFGCGYGVTAKLKKFSPKETVLKKGLTACMAVAACANKAPFGSFVVSWYKPSKTWLCTLYDNAPGYEYDPSLHLQHINDMTLTAKNSSIGASYGWWLYDEFAPDGS